MDRQHGLMHATVSQHTVGNVPEIVVGGGCVLITFQWCGGSRAGGCGLSCANCWARYLRLCAWCSRRCGYRLFYCGKDYALRGIERWGQQQGVLTLQLAIGPEHF